MGGSASWKNFVLICDSGGHRACRSALVLDASGRGITEHVFNESFSADAPRELAIPHRRRFWSVSRRLNATIRAIARLTGAEATATCSGTPEPIRPNANSTSPL